MAVIALDVQATNDFFARQGPAVVFKERDYLPSFRRFRVDSVLLLRFISFLVHRDCPGL
jgi:hypothetical protein